MDDLCIHRYSDGTLCGGPEDDCLHDNWLREIAAQSSEHDFRSFRDAEAENARLAAEVARKDEALEAAEWGGREKSCPVCKGASYAMYPGEEVGHRDDCLLAAARAALTPEEDE